MSASFLEKQSNPVAVARMKLSCISPQNYNAKQKLLEVNYFWHLTSWWEWGTVICFAGFKKRHDCRRCPISATESYLFTLTPNKTSERKYQVTNFQIFSCINIFLFLHIYGTCCSKGGNGLNEVAIQKPSLGSKPHWFFKRTTSNKNMSVTCITLPFC